MGGKFRVSGWIHRRKNFVISSDRFPPISQRCDFEGKSQLRYSQSGEICRCQSSEGVHAKTPGRKENIPLNRALCFLGSRSISSLIRPRRAVIGTDENSGELTDLASWK